MSLTIYGIAASRAARVLWLLEEMGIAYQHVNQDYKHGATRNAEFLALNPNGHIPVIDDNGTVVWESMAINLYLVHRYGGALAPATAPQYAETVRWSFWSVTECEKDALTVLFQRVAGPVSQRDPEKLRQAEARLRQPLGVLNNHLADTPYIASGQFTVADVNVASVVGWARPSRELLHSFGHVADWLERCLQRSAQQRVRDMARGA